MGDCNSSVTRVWPVFDYLLNQDATGKSWLPSLLRLANAKADLCAAPGQLLPELAKFKRELPGNMRRVLGTENCARLPKLRYAFEAEFAPPTSFLRWLLEHPEKLTWPQKRGIRLVFGEATQQFRQRLLAGGLRSPIESVGTVGKVRRTHFVAPLVGV